MNAHSVQNLKEHKRVVLCLQLYILYIQVTYGLGQKMFTKFVPLLHRAKSTSYQGFRL